MLGLLLLFVAGRCLVPMDETDVFFNLRLGELVLGSGHVPTQNVLSFTYPAATDVNLAWLFQILLALVHRAAGIPGTVLLKTAFVLATWALLFRVAVRRGARPALAALALALAAWAAEPRFVERPHLVTFLGLGLVLLALERAEAGRPRMLWCLLPGGLLWANSNSCFFLAPALLLLYALGAWRDGLRLEGRRALRVACLLIPLMFATPSGTHCLSYIANHWRMPSLRPLQEYRSARWPLDGPYFFLVLGLLGAGLLPLVRRSLPRLVPARVLLPCAALALLGGLRIRFVAEFSILAGPALAVALSRLVPEWRLRWQAWAAGVTLLALTVLPRARALAEGTRVLDLGVEADLVPYAAVEFVESHGLTGRMYNDLEVGSYLTWRGWPRYRVFQDPRINGYPAEFHAVLRRSDLSREEWQALLDRFGVTAALITYPGVNPRGALFDPEAWALVYRAGDGLVFVRRSAHGDLPELPLSFSYTAASGLVPFPLLTRPAGAGTSECEWQRQLGEYFRSSSRVSLAGAAYERALAGSDDAQCQVLVRRAWGALALQEGDAAKAADLLGGLSDSADKVNHAYALLGLGKAEGALREFDAVLTQEPIHDEAAFGRGLALVALGRRSEAATCFETLLARSPTHVSAPAARKQLARLRE